MNGWAEQTVEPAPRQETSRIPYLPGLDGLRAVAVVSVMLYHANHSWLGGGFLGVEVFFVISGYLITLLLIGERDRTGAVDLKQFWVRRFRRLLPALFTMMAALGVYMALFQRRPQGQTRGDFLGGIFYVSNWYQIFVGQGYTANEAFAPLRHLWSLAVEEQFYLLWPLVMVAILRRGTQRLPRVALWLVGISAFIAVITAALYVGGDVANTCSSTANGYWHVFGRCINANEALYLSTITRAGGLLLGSAFAMVWRPAAIMRGPLRDRPGRLDAFAGIGLLVLAVMFSRLTVAVEGATLGTHFDAWLFRGGFLLTGLATLLVVAAATHQRSLTGALLGNPVFAWIGTRSYGLYLYHWPIYQIIRKEAGVQLTVAKFVLAMVITVPITELSYRFIETPIRQGKLGEWWKARRAGTRAGSRNGAIIGGSVAVLVLATGLSFAMADNQCVGAVSCSLVGAGPVGPSTPATDPATDPTTPTGTGVTVGTPIETTPTTPVVIGPVAIGESVMVGATNELLQAGFIVDAAEDRQGSDVAQILSTMRANNQLGDTVVIQVGTNGTVSDDAWASIMASLPADLTPHVYVLTVRAPANWIEGNNARINALPTTYPNVTVVDWATESEQIVDQLCPNDGHVHLTCNKAAPIFYTNLILAKAGLALLPTA